VANYEVDPVSPHLKKRKKKKEEEEEERLGGGKEIVGMTGLGRENGSVVVENKVCPCCT
jgi:hypothetical protein